MYAAERKMKRSVVRVYTQDNREGHGRHKRVSYHFPSRRAGQFYFQGTSIDISHYEVFYKYQAMTLS